MSYYKIRTKNGHTITIEASGDDDFIAKIASMGILGCYGNVTQIDKAGRRDHQFKTVWKR